VTRYLDPMLGRYRIRDLDADRLERFQLELKARGLSDRTVLKVWRALRKSLQDARLGRNPCDAVETPRVRDQRQIVRPTTAEVLEFVNHVSVCDRKAGQRQAVLWRLVATTGIRRGEACGLAWADVDLDAGLMTVRTSMGVDHGELFTKGPKSAAGHRTVGLDPVTVEALRSHRHVQAQEVSGVGNRYETLPLGLDLVFRGEPDGRPVRPSNLSWSFRHEWRHAELRTGVTLHGLRHAHGSALLLAGLPAIQVAARLGHAPHVLMSIYAGELDSAERQQVLAQAAATLYG
jgi:integrase